jgi:hypothetical protein
MKIHEWMRSNVEVESFRSLPRKDEGHGHQATGEDIVVYDFLLIVGVPHVHETA